MTGKLLSQKERDNYLKCGKHKGTVLVWSESNGFHVCPICHEEIKAERRRRKA